MGRGKQKYSGHKGYRGNNKDLIGKVNPKKKHYPSGCKPQKYGQ